MTDTVNVPREPTPEMWSAGERAFDRDPDLHHETVLANVWVAMLAAAPKAEPVSDPYKLGEGEVLQWVDGCPDKFRSGEWFIAMTSFGDRVCLKALPEEYSYDFTTADGTYIKADKIVKWMPFPDSEFRHPAQPEAPKVEQEPVAWLRDAHGGQDDECLVPAAKGDPDAFPVYRDAPASDALLEALEELVRGWHDDDISTVDVMNGIDSLIAKHKGPQ